MVVELTCEVLGTDKNEIAPPESSKFWSMEKRQQWLFNRVEPLVDLLSPKFDAPNMESVPMHIISPNGSFDIFAPANLRGQHLDMYLNGQLVRIPVPGDQQQPEHTNDDVYNYSLSFLRVCMDLLQLDDLIKAGDIERLTIIQKKLIPTFIGLASYRSKYAIECVNFLTKTECILSIKDSIAVKLAAFVNPSGRAGHNKAADMQQENNIKMVKTVIRGLGAGKTDQALERVSKAAPVVTCITENFQKMTGTKVKSGKHVSKPSTGDIEILCQQLRKYRPFRKTEGRSLPSFPGIRADVMDLLDKYKLREFISRHSRRTASNMAIDNDEGNGVDP